METSKIFLIFRSKKTMSDIVLKRIYEEALPTDGYRMLVDRLWPRGISKDTASIDEWNKDVAPSTALRNWFNHEPEIWNALSDRYFAELRANDAAETFWKAHERQEKITLVYAAKDEKHCHPFVLMKYLKSKG